MTFMLTISLLVVAATLEGEMIHSAESNVLQRVQCCAAEGGWAL